MASRAMALGLQPSRPADPDRHRRLAHDPQQVWSARDVALAAARSWDQLVMAAGETFRPNEIGGAKVLDPSSVERHHRRGLSCLFVLMYRPQSKECQPSRRHLLGPPTTTTNWPSCCLGLTVPCAFSTLGGYEGPAKTEGFRDDYDFREGLVKLLG
jgi:hypothetical protein